MKTTQRMATEECVLKALRMGKKKLLLYFAMLGQVKKVLQADDS